MITKNEELPAEIADNLADDALKLDGLNEAIIGISTQGYLVYCYDKIVDVIMNNGEMDRGEAIEFADYNILGLDGNGNWTIVYPTYYYL
ncbi:MAG: hypothetical protein ACO3HJ_06605 [Methylophilaceae bacterium]